MIGCRIEDKQGVRFAYGFAVLEVGKVGLFWLVGCWLVVLPRRRALVGHVEVLVFGNWRL
jgi:hypothetical protein